MKNRKEKERKKSWDQVFNKRKYCVGTEPSALVYIGILVTSTYKLGYVKRGSTAFKVPKDGCGVPSAARALLGPEGLLMR